MEHDLATQQGLRDVLPVANVDAPETHARQRLLEIRDTATLKIIENQDWCNTQLGQPFYKVASYEARATCHDDTIVHLQISAVPFVRIGRLYQGLRCLSGLTDLPIVLPNTDSIPVISTACSPEVSPVWW